MKKNAFKKIISTFIVCLLLFSVIVTPVAAQIGFSDDGSQVWDQDTYNQSTDVAATSDPEANLPFLFAVFATTWLAFFAYLYYVSQRQASLKRELEELQSIINGDSNEKR